MNIILENNYEDKEREMINTLNRKVFINDPIQKTIDKTNQVDCYNRTYVVELKYRNIFSTQYNDCILEKKKYDAVMERSLSRNKTAGYIALFNDGVYYAWNLTQLTQEGYDFKWKNKFMKATTYFENNEQKLKLSSLLPLSKGVKLI